MSHLNMKVDIKHPFFREISAYMLNDEINIVEYPPTGKSLGHNIHWETVNADDPRSIPGYVTFVFKNEADKLFFILKL